MERSIAAISTIMALLKNKKRRAHEPHRNTGLFPTEHPPPHHPELEVFPPPKLPSGSMGNAPENQVPGGVDIFSNLFSKRQRPLHSA